MTQPYTAADFALTAFNCSLCGAYAQQKWYGVTEYDYEGYIRNQVEDYALALCDHCNKHSIWVNRVMVYPLVGSAPLPNSDMPEDIKNDYQEARNLSMISPRGAAALLRLVIQKLCKHLGQSGKDINKDIAALVKDGLSVKLQQALDTVRVVGNNAVHPGQIDLNDDLTVVNKLFVFINIICDTLISQPKQISDTYERIVPDNLKQAIEKRDAR